MVLLSLPLTLVAMAPLPLVLYAGIRLRNRVFPLSWGDPGPHGGPGDDRG